jgi:hypothetical protein
MGGEIASFSSIAPKAGGFKCISKRYFKKVERGLGAFGWKRVPFPNAKGRTTCGSPLEPAGMGKSRSPECAEFILEFILAAISCYCCLLHAIRRQKPVRRNSESPKSRGFCFIPPEGSDFTKNGGFLARRFFELAELIGNRFWPFGALARSLKLEALISMPACCQMGL